MGTSLKTLKLALYLPTSLTNATLYPGAKIPAEAEKYIQAAKECYTFPKRAHFAECASIDIWEVADTYDELVILEYPDNITEVEYAVPKGAEAFILAFLEMRKPISSLELYTSENSGFHTEHFNIRGDEEEHFGQILSGVPLDINILTEEQTKAADASWVALITNNP